MSGNVLIVEDHAPTARLTSRIVEGLDPGLSAHVVGNGQACLAVLQRDDAAIPRPDLVLLDLELPEVSGLTVLETSGEDPTFPEIPIVVVSGSGDRETIGVCYELGANAFVAKPRDLEGYRTAISGIITFWMGPGESSVSADEGDYRDHDQGTVTGG